MGVLVSSKSNYLTDTEKMKKQKPTTDQIIRDALLSKLERKYKSDNSIRIIEELGLDHGAARVDIAVLNGIMHGYEIKSDADTLYRLPQQIEAYNSVFKKMTIVVGANHVEDVINMVPDWWEIVLVRPSNRSDVSFCKIRSGLINKNQDKEAIARLLWKDEAINILRELGAQRGVVSQPRAVVYERLANTLDSKTLQDRVRGILLTRSGWRADLV